jgi:hypothetical protein
MPAWNQGCFKLRMSPPPVFSSYNFKTPEYIVGTTSSGLVIFGDSGSLINGDYEITGKIRNNGNLLSKNVMVSATLYNSSGVPVDCERTIVDILPGATSDFKISSWVVRVQRCG